MDIINLGILAHVDAGKTSITENILFKTGTINSIGRVDDGNTTTDSHSIERERGITIKASTISFEWNNKKFNLIDTPGHFDFIAEVERSLQVLDAVFLIISAKEGVQAQTKIIFNILKKMKIPTLIFINKLDRIGINLEDLYDSIQNNLGIYPLKMQSIKNEGTKNFILTNWIDNLSLQHEVIAELSRNDDQILSKYLNKHKMDVSDIEYYLCNQISQGEIFPIYHGSAFTGTGIGELLEATKYLTISPTLNNEKLSGIVYKIEKENAHKKNIYIRIFQGTLRIRENIEIRNKNKTFKVKNLEYLKSGKVEKCNSVIAGDIAILTNVSELQIGDIIGDYCEFIKITSIVEPTLKTTISVRLKDKRLLLIEALRELTEEDPYLNLEVNEKTDEISVKLFGIIQMEVIQKILQEKYNLTAIFSEPKTIFKITPKISSEATILAGERENPFVACMTLLVEPLPKGKGFEFKSLVSTGYLKKGFQLGVQDGLLKSLIEDFEYELTDLRVTLKWALFDSANSTPSDFRNLAPLVLKKAVGNNKVELLEPYLTFELIIPMMYTGRALSDLRKMRAQVKNTLVIADQMKIIGMVPVETSKLYSVTLASYTSGQGIFLTDYSGYEIYNNCHH